MVWKLDTFWWIPWRAVGLPKLCKFFSVTHTKTHQFRTQKRGSLKTPGSCPRCWEEVDVTEKMLPLWQCSGPARQVRDTCWCIWQTIIILGFDLGGRGENKAFGKQLLEQKVDRQSCQREAVNSLFVVSNSYSKQTNNCRLYLLIFLIRGLLRCSCRGGMQWGLPSWRAVCLHLVQMLPQLQQQV